MSKQFVQNKYMAGDVVCAKVNPTLMKKMPSLLGIKPVIGEY